MSRIQDAAPNTKLVLRGNGVYGCFFRPGPMCGERLPVREQGTKLQKKGNASVNELSISQHIQSNIADWQDYFAPVLRDCALGTISFDNAESEVINKCTLLEEARVSGTEISVAEMEFVGEDTFLKGALAVINAYQRTDTQRAVDFVIDMLSVIDIAMTKLTAAGVVHFDLKADNVVLRISGPDSLLDKLPVVIDFGLSFLLADMGLDARMEDIFYSTKPVRQWPLEATLLGVIVEGIDLYGRQNTNSIISHFIKEKSAKTKQWVDGFRSLTPDERKVLWTKKFTRLNELFNKIEAPVTLEAIVSVLQRNASNWNQYAFAVMAFEFFHSFRVVTEEVILQKRYYLKMIYES